MPNPDMRADKRNATKTPSALLEAKAGLTGKKVKVATVTDAERKQTMEAELRTEAKASGAPRVAAQNKPVGHLARGLDSRNAPHSAKAVADNKAKEKPATKAEKAKPAPRADKKAATAAKAAPKSDDARKITVLDKKFTYGKEGTTRRSSWDACTKAKTVADYAAAGGALKYLPRWAASGAIKLG